MWGDAATRNHEGGWFTAGSLVGTVLMTFISPCNFGTLGKLAYRIANAGDLIENGIGAVQDIMAGNYLSAGLKIASMVMNLANLGKACFTGDMLVITRRGRLRWDALTIDDEVLSGDEHDAIGSLEYKRVEELFVTYARIWHLYFDSGMVIRTTAEHPFYVVGKGWTPCCELKPGDALRSEDGNTVRVAEVLDGGYEEKVYNCRVADWHTYFVAAEFGGAAVWAHNQYRNAGLAGTRHPRTGVQFNSNGFPVFSSRFDAKLKNALYKASDYRQFKAANQQLKRAIEADQNLKKLFTPSQLRDIARGRTPRGLTWHHHENAGRMQLVDRRLHARTGHTGGREIWGGGTEFR